MFHASTQKLIDDWARRCEGRRAPLRADFSPTTLGELMPQLCMLDARDDSFRLIGGLISDLHGQDLRGELFQSLWRPEDAAKAAAATAEVRATLQPVVVSALAHTAEGYETRLEIALAPLLGAGGHVERLLGLYQPTSSLARLLGKPVLTLSFRNQQPADATEPLWTAQTAQPSKTGLRVVSVDGRRVA
jgi:hypothetical protein